VKKLRVTINGVTYDVEVEVLEDDDELGSYGYAATNLPTSAAHPGASPPQAQPHGLAGPTPAPPHAGSNTLISPIAGIVKDIKVKPGNSVKINDPLIVIEAMKMETIISSPVSGKIREINVEAGQSVQQGQVLVTFQ